MALYSNLFLRFARGLVNAFSDASAFAYHTRLVPVTDALRHSDPVRMRTSLSLISQGWSGGTRIGDCLREFNDGYARLLNSRSVVIVVSDGLDTGEPELLNALMRIWSDVVDKKMYVTGAIGAYHHGVSVRFDLVHEAFGREYELPLRTAYNETCANISNAMFNRRMLMLTGEGRFGDVVERVVCNSGL